MLAAGRARDVGELVRRLRLPQPTVSKHLGVLRHVGLVTVEKLGQRRVYRLNPEELKPVHEWVRSFERLWADHLAAVKRAAEAAASSASDSFPSPISKETRDDR